jgi:hypothetical protein
MMTSTIRATLTLLLGGALLAACTSLPLPPAAPVAAIGTALLAIDVVNRHRSEVAPVMLELVVEDERGRQWRITRAAETPATDAGRDFLFALELPPGRHRVRALAGRLRAGDDDGVLQHAVDIPFDVEAGRSRYLGRLSLENVARRDRRDQASGPPFPASAQHRFGLSDLSGASAAVGRAGCAQRGRRRAGATGTLAAVAAVVRRDGCQPAGRHGCAPGAARGRGAAPVACGQCGAAGVARVR